MIYFTSDLHFNHKNVIEYSNRPFSSVDEMNEILINNWNSTVAKTDTIYILGDFSFGSDEFTKKLIETLNGNKIWVLGNHDRNPKHRNLYVGNSNYRELTVKFGSNRQHIVMCHYAFRTWNRSHYGSWNLYGHSHGSLKPVGKQLDVGVDATRHYHEWFGIDSGVKPYSPVSVDQIKLLLDSVELKGEHV